MRRSISIVSEITASAIVELSIAPSPSHFTMRTPRLAAVSRSAVRSSARTGTTFSSPWRSPQAVKPGGCQTLERRSSLLLTGLLLGLVGLGLARGPRCRSGRRLRACPWRLRRIRRRRPRCHCRHPWGFSSDRPISGRRSLPHRRRHRTARTSHRSRRSRGTGRRVMKRRKGRPAGRPFRITSARTAPRPPYTRRSFGVSWNFVD